MEKMEITKQPLRRLWHHLGAVRRVQFVLILGLMIVSSLAEIVSIGAVLPFIGALTAPERVFEQVYVQPIVEVFGIAEPHDLLFPMTMLFCLAIVTAALMRLLLLWCTTRLSFDTGADISMKMYELTLSQPYSVHVNRNSSEIINSISSKSSMIISNALLPILTLVMSAFMILSISSLLFIIEPIVALTAVFGFGSLYALILFLTKDLMAFHSNEMAKQSTNVIKLLQEGLGSIREIIIDGTRGVYTREYDKSNKALRRSQGQSLFVAASPRLLVEGMGTVLIVILAYMYSKEKTDVTEMLPILGAFALGAQRLLPILQQGYGAWSALRAVSHSLFDAILLLDQEPDDGQKEVDQDSILFEESIEIHNLCFLYDAEFPPVLDCIDVKIPKGSRLGILGTTGCGKSTLVDLVMGLLTPCSGSVEVDGVPITSSNQRNWQKRIAHVPQVIFLADCTIEENIALGVPIDCVDYARLERAVVCAQLKETISSLPDGFKTMVGERGVRLSGGQRQRIGIARALYKDADVIVLDEATSALDSTTEGSFMRSLGGMAEGLTIIMVAHRLSTLQTCDQVVELNKGRVLRIGTYSSVVGQI